MHSLLEQLYKTSWLEVIAMVTGLLFPIFSALEKKICWLFGGVSSLLYIWIMFNGKLYQDAALNLYYVIMAIVGYLMWSGVIRSKKKELVISSSNWKWITVYILIGIGYAAVGGYIFQSKTDASYPYTDAFITGFAFVATWLDAKKKIENWYIFLMVDIVSVWLFIQKGYILTAILFIIYCFICIYGIVQWHRKIKSFKLQ